MSSNVIKLIPSAADQLRLLADQIEAGDYPCDGVTIVAGREVFRCSTESDRAAVSSVVFDCTWAISKLMEAIHAGH